MLNSIASINLYNSISTVTFSIIIKTISLKTKIGVIYTAKYLQYLYVVPIFDKYNVKCYILNSTQMQRVLQTLYPLYTNLILYFNKIINLP